ncbi:MAG: cell division protein FtsI (penicillin-binding protein 3) [Nitrospirae bacterium]|nr:MAG: cell division protein FtsI (penicillin-binding protein 3) [Nitrospirota bacterium]
MNRRGMVLVAIISVAFIAVVVRLADIMVMNHDWFLAKARGQQTKQENIPVKRGIIYDRMGRELAVNLETESVFCDPAEISAHDDVAKSLSRELGSDARVVLTKLNADKRFYWVERKVELARAQRIRDMKLKGIGFIPELKRYYPKGSLASHVVGFVNSDNTGLEGIERELDKQLSTQTEKLTKGKDARGQTLSEGSMKELKGNDVVLTVDEGLQHIVEKNLDEIMAKWHAASATIIMMNPHTGEILALANRPAYNLNNASGTSMQKLRNRAITDSYEPGSTFKVVVGSAALEEGTVNSRSMFDCSAGTVEVGGRRIKDDHRNGVLSFEEVIQKSSNVGTIKIGLGLGKQRVYDYVKKFGFGERTGIDLAGEVSGLVRHPDKWSGMSIGAISIGQEIAVTPLQVLRAYAVIANGGLLVKPHVVAEIRTPQGQQVYRANNEKERVLSEKTAIAFRSILKRVTEEGGTAKSASIDGNQVAGKTGTAQLFDQRTKRYSKERYVSSFVGFVPADDPRIAMIVVVHEPKGAIYGGVVAGPAFKAIANESLSYLSVPRDDQRERGLLLVSNRERVYP